MFEIKIGDWYEQGFRSFTAKINEGLTILVGPNGSGKTTMLKQIRHQVEKNDDSIIISWDNYLQGGTNQLQKMMDFGNCDMGTFAGIVTGSEGQRISRNFNEVASKIGTTIRREAEKENKLKVFILIDAVDSGLSIENIVDFREMFDLVERDSLEKGVETYLIVSANTYEMARDADCIYVRTGKHLRFSDYESYKKFIIEKADKETEQWNKSVEKRKKNRRSRKF